MRSGADVMSEECRQIDRELDQILSQPASARAAEGRALPERALAPNTLAHLRECERCRRLYDWLLTGSSPMGLAPSVTDAIQARMKQTLAPVKPQARPGVLAAQFLLVFLLFSAPMIGMMGTAGWREMTLGQAMGIGAVLVCGAALLSFSLAWQMSPGSLHRVPPRTAVITLATGFLAATAVLFPWREPQEFWERGWECLQAGVLMAIPSALLFWVLLRRGHTLASGMLGATLGAIAGLVGASVLQFACNRQDAVHLLVWHGGVVIVSLLIGVVVTWGAHHLVRSRV